MNRAERDAKLKAEAADITWSEVFKLFRTKEGRRFVGAGYKMIFGYMEWPETELTEEEKNQNYDRLIVRSRTSARHKAQRLSAKLSLNAVALLPQPGNTESTDSASLRLDELAVNALRPKPPDLPVIQLTQSEPMPEAA
jgi:hypothetical protein